MATYTIIGGDGKEYGPVSGEDLRKWIAEGRLSAQSLAKAESDAAFRPLSAFPELADAFAPQAPMPGAPPVFSTAANLGEGDYELDIGGCLTCGWNLLKNNEVMRQLKSVGYKTVAFQEDAPLVEFDNSDVLI